MKKYFILSLKWTCPNDVCFSFWRANHRGYTAFIGAAGLYPEDQAKKIVGSDFVKTSVMVPDSAELRNLFVHAAYEDAAPKVLPINEKTLAFLGLKREDLQAKYCSTNGIEI